MLSHALCLPLKEFRMMVYQSECKYKSKDPKKQPEMLSGFKGENIMKVISSMINGGT